MCLQHGFSFNAKVVFAGYTRFPASKAMKMSKATSRMEADRKWNEIVLMLFGAIEVSYNHNALLPCNFDEMCLYFGLLVKQKAKEGWELTEEQRFFIENFNLQLFETLVWDLMSRKSLLISANWRTFAGIYCILNISARINFRYTKGDSYLNFGFPCPYKPHNDYLFTFDFKEGCEFIRTFSSYALDEKNGSLGESEKCMSGSFYFSPYFIKGRTKKGEYQMLDY